MHTATYWVILATVVSLAHRSTVSGQDGEQDDEQTIAKLTKCCMTDKALAVIFKPEVKGCLGRIYETEMSPQEMAAEADSICMVECILEKNGMINEDKSVKETELKDLLTGSAEADWKRAMEAALNKCFDHYNKNNDKGVHCKSGAQHLFDCIAGELVVNCPASLWHADKAECTPAAREKLRIALTGA